MDAKDIQNQIYQDYLNEREANDEKRSKQSFWASDCLKPLNELFWAWTNVPKTNPVSPEKLSMFDIGKLCELHVIRRLQKGGIAADLENEGDVSLVNSVLKTPLAFAKHHDEFGCRQIRMEMEREYVPVTGYLDGITLRGEPIEVKSTRSSKYIKDVATGRPPQKEHVYQLACYMDFLGSKYGWLIVTSRPDGVIMVVQVENLFDGTFITVSSSIGLPEEMGGSGGSEFRDAPEHEPLLIDLHAEFKRWRKLYEDHIHPNKETPLQFEYRPTITKEILEMYPEDKIKKAIKGDRILNEHEWKPMYCDWRDLWIAKEMKQKGFTDKDEFFRYAPEEIDLMMDHLQVEWKETKSGKNKGQMRLFKKKK